MNRRVLLVAAAAAALTLAPGVATATDYNAAGYTCTVSDSTPTSGVQFTSNASGVTAGGAVTLAVTGSPTLISTATGGRASFKVTINKAGTYTLTSRAAGKVLCTQSVTVGDVVAFTGPGTTGGATNGAGGGQLAFTGAQVTGLAAGGGLLVLVGAGAVLVSRRRKSEKVPA